MRILGLVAISFLLCTSLPAQVVISQTMFNGDGDTNQGQSFRPGGFNQSGSYTTSDAYLTQFTFVVTSNGSARPNNEAYLLIYSGTYSGGTVSGGSLLDVSTNTQNWSVIGAGGTATFTFAGNTALNVSTTYLAVFSTSSSSIANQNHGVRFSNSELYGGGNLLHNGEPLSNHDAQFTATFATSAVPEPSTYAALLGVAALGFVCWRRQRNRA